MPSTQPVTPAPRRPGRPFKASADAASAIRKAALKSFSDFGFAGASIVDIAKAAGVAKPLIHYHFVSKDALWQAAVADAFGDLQTELTLFQAQLMALTPLDAVRQMARQLVVFAARHPQLVRIVVDETGKGGPRGEWLHDNFLLPGYRLSKGIIDGLSQQLNLGDKAPAAAGVIHSDFERGFIAAEVVHYDDLVTLGSKHAAKEVGKLRIEGKEYIVKDGDVIEFRFNVSK